MSVAQVVEACNLYAIFEQQGYLFRARVCLDIALDNLLKLRQQVGSMTQVVAMIDKRETKCLQLMEEINTKIKQRTLIKLYKFK
ncbi:hypothetical protein AGNV_041 [Anticarsia gemmatalis multiple nucleopolyhedrovirus]|uniref:Uncharacterized protein n=1 Tax=Anticarsia gemmatalis multiple nucleopolyhedrovirus TaxID=268591 RepID=A0A0S3J1B6_9ABAC|nr:hypothetical protein AGNV_041 [Anticarsia gemmatalis multiple nucleopolyhedrovirus]YP_803512.1 hypothetical protein AGNV_041 [Anticarsia gemmatalis nucleopolyhedrovirus]ABI13901.1 hypothetical protein AGNV_041 [Anticarsia gemmatalis multiple nucleopolyhedrovirus]ALR70163.1 hypothetical protein AGNV_041 [Anticarsia gemmatalis multiple nucleopolyhedrovirus]ALR70476.1 hypothetical protein AGNV_041 [Anticarsia gemmatalis multiple nucleopolyhedrovirus]ALR70633.1 hypothetical protein AGNV_041 [An